MVRNEAILLFPLACWCCYDSVRVVEVEGGLGFLASSSFSLVGIS